MKTKILSVIFLLGITLFSCEETEDPAGIRQSAVVPVVSEADPDTFIEGDANSFIEFTANLGEGASVDAASVVVSHQNFERAKVADVTSFPATVNLTLGQVSQALGITLAEIAGGDVITVEIETTKGGLTSRSNAALNIGVMAFCPLTGGISDLVGSWSASDIGNNGTTVTVPVTTEIDGTQLKMSGLGVKFIEDFWGESVTSGGSFLVTVTNDGKVTIPRQYIYTTDYEGDAYDYEIAGSGTWDNCGAKPKLLITYDIYYPEDASGLAKQYSTYLGGISVLTAEITMN